MEIALENNKFQSTLPRRERLDTDKFAKTLVDNFNPRSREGSDKSETDKRKEECYFNPRSREGSDLVAVLLILF